MRSSTLRRSSRPHQVGKTSSRSSTRTKSSFSYRELSSGDELEMEHSPPSPPPAKRRRIAPPAPSPSRPQTRAVTHKGRPRGVKAKQASSRTPMRKATSKPVDTAKAFAKPHSIPTDDVIPPWQTLPYQILFSIFQYALHSSQDDVLLRNGLSFSWLARACRTCKAFAEPALSALYENPPLVYIEDPHRLQNLLRKDRGYINYKAKIRRLQMDSIRTLAYTSPGYGHLDLAALISSLPNLLGVHISEPYDRAPYRMMSHKGRWYYPENLIPALQENGIRLKEWRWAGQMMSKTFPSLSWVHSSTPFRDLQHLALSHIDFPMQASGSRKSGYEVFPEDLIGLRDLQSLSLESCYSEDWKILWQLPRQLRELSVVNCSSFDSSVLKPFLFEYGASLRSLSLNHNHALDLSWLVNLKSCCPKLETIRMDLTYFSSALLFQNVDAEPVFHSLLEPEEAPTWPSSLQNIEMINLRRWSPEAAVTFFESLVNSAAELPVLKYLRIKAMLNIGWRDRAGFRERWISRLISTFLRKSSPPRPYLASFKAHRLWKGAIERKQAEREQKESSSKSESDKRVTRSAQHEHTVEDSKNADDPMSTFESRGTCEIVDIGIDNMRPTETRMTEADFLDSELSGDEDWTGERSSPRPSYAW